MVDTTSLDAVKKELIGPGLLLGKDRGVKAHVACCLADLLRLYAPDAPYTSRELSVRHSSHKSQSNLFADPRPDGPDVSTPQDIFQFFIRQLKNLTGPQCPNYQEYFYLIESLSNVKSAVLVCDVPGAEQLVTEAFKQFFDLAK